MEPSDCGEIELTDAIDLLIAAGYDVRAVPATSLRVNVDTEADRQEATRPVRASDWFDGP